MLSLFFKECVWEQDFHSSGGYIFPSFCLFVCLLNLPYFISLTTDASATRSQSDRSESIRFYVTPTLLCPPRRQCDVMRGTGASEAARLWVLPAWGSPALLRGTSSGLWSSASSPVKWGNHIYIMVLL